MRDLPTALRDHIEGLAPPVRYDDVVSRRPQPVRPSPVLIAAAVLVLVGVAAVVLWSGDDAGQHVATGPLDSSARALRDGGTGSDLVWTADAGLTLGDPETGAQRPLGGPALQCSTCPILRLGQSLFVAGDDGVYRLDPPDLTPRRIADGNLVFAATAPGELFVATTSSAAPQGSDVRHITTDGAILGGPWPVPDGQSLAHPPRATATGIVIESPPNSFRKTYTIWNPTTGALAPLGDGVQLIDTYTAEGTTTVAWLRAGCYGDDCRLAVTDLATGRTRHPRSPGGDVGFIGGGAFSPDGTKLAAFSVLNRGSVGGSAGGRRMRLVIVDVRTGAVTPIARSTGEFGEPHGFATWSPDGRWVFFGGLQQHVSAHRLGTRDAVPLELPALYSTAAVSAVPPPQPTGDLADGRHFGFVKAIDERRRILTFDLAEHLTGAEANRAAAEDGAINPGETAPNDYYIRNRNFRLREVPYSSDVTVHGSPECTPVIEVCTYLAYDIPALVNRVRNPDAPFAGGVEGVRVWLTVVDGVVVDIENPYFP